MKIAVYSAAMIAVLAVLLTSVPAAAATEAGPILSTRNAIAILGDSYSAGEGTDVYLDWTDTDANPCHRSPHTYLAEAFDIPARRIAACSGAVARDVHFPQRNRTVAGQAEQLTRMREREGVDAVVLTLGGNDAGFTSVAVSCLIDRCAKRIYALSSGRIQASDAFVDERLDALPAALRAAYLALNYAVNGAEARATAGPVPIVVLAYPLSTPAVEPARCAPVHNLLKGDIGFLNELTRRLNDTIEETVLETREEDGVPIFFVPETESAFRPDHTLCDAVPYARALTSFDGLNRASLERAVDSLGKTPGRIWRSVRELFHPNRDGYAAMSQTAIRWSRSPEAIEAVEIVEGAPVADHPPPVTPDDDDGTPVVTILLVALGAIAIGVLVVVFVRHRARARSG